MWPACIYLSFALTFSISFCKSFSIHGVKASTRGADRSGMWHFQTQAEGAGGEARIAMSMAATEREWRVAGMQDGGRQEDVDDSERRDSGEKEREGSDPGEGGERGGRGDGRCGGDKTVAPHKTARKAILPMQ